MLQRRGYEDHFWPLPWEPEGKNLQCTTRETSFMQSARINSQEQNEKHDQSLMQAVKL